MPKKEYIERGALEKAIDKGHWKYSLTMPNKCNFKEIARTIPAADVVEVVRCKECKHGESRQPSRLGFVWCYKWGNFLTARDFCSCGERKE